MFKTTIITTLFCVGLSAFWMRYSHLLVRGLSIMAKEVKVEPYSMAFVTAPNKEVAKTLAGGLGKIITKHNMNVDFVKCFYTNLIVCQSDKVILNQSV